MHFVKVDEFQKYVETNASYGNREKDSYYMCRRILAYVAMLLSIQDAKEVEKKIKNSKIYEFFAAAFSISGITPSDLKTLFEEMDNCQR